MPACLSVCYSLAVSVVVAVVSRNTVHSLVSADVDKDLIIITPEQLHGSWCLPHSFSPPVPHHPLWYQRPLLHHSLMTGPHNLVVELSNQPLPLILDQQVSSWHKHMHARLVTYAVIYSHGNTVTYSTHRKTSLL